MGRALLCAARRVRGPACQRNVKGQLSFAAPGNHPKPTLGRSAGATVIAIRRHVELSAQPKFLQLTALIFGHTYFFFSPAGPGSLISTLKILLTGYMLPAPRPFPSS